MAENKDLNLTAAEHELDENKNPPSLNLSSSISTVDNSFNTMNCEPEKYLSESQNISADVLISSGLSTPQKNSLIDSGFHCENLEKTTLPDLVNNSLCESVDNEFSNITHEEKQVSFCSNNDNSLNECKDASFNVTANTTTNNIELLFERLTLNSDGNTSRCNDLENSSESVAVPDEKLNVNLMPSTSLNQPMLPELSLNENCEYPNVTDDSNGSKLENLDTSVSFDKNLQQPSPVSNEVPHDETIIASNLDKGVAEPSPDLNKVPLDKTFATSDTSKNSTATFPVPELNKVPLDETFITSNQVDMSFDTDIGSLGSNPSKVSSSNQVDMSIDTDIGSLGSNPSKVSSSNQVDMSIDTDIGLDSNPPIVANSECPFSSETSIDDIFKQPFPVSETFAVPCIQNVADDYVFVGNPDDNFEEEEFQDAAQFFKDPSSFQVFENTSSSGASMPRDSLYMTFDPLYKRVVQPVPSDNLNAEKNQLAANHVPDRKSLGGNLVSFDSPLKRNSVGNSKEEIGDLSEEPVKEEIHDVSCVDNNQSMNKSSFENCENLKENNAEVNQQLELVNKHISDIPTRASLVGNLLSFDSPMKSNSTRNSECSKASALEHDEKIYTEEEFQQALKIFELTMQESFLKKQREIEVEALKKQKELEEGALKKQKELEEGALKKQREMEEETLRKQKELEEVLKKHEEMEEALKMQKEIEKASKHQKEIEKEALKEKSDTDKKLHQVTELCKVLLETVSELAEVATEQNVKIGDLSAKIATLESEKQKLDSDLKTSNQDLQNVETTFSDFHKRYVQCKDMLKSYKENEDRLKAQVECLNKRLEEQEQTNNMLQVKMGEVVEKANAEVATAKKGGDAQVAVLKAQLKKSELKVSSLESDLKQVRIENDKLSSICDDLMAKVSEA